MFPKFHIHILVYHISKTYCHNFSFVTEEQSLTIISVTNALRTVTIFSCTMRNMVVAVTLSIRDKALYFITLAILMSSTT